MSCQHCQQHNNQHPPSVETYAKMRDELAQRHPSFRAHELPADKLDRIRAFVRKSTAAFDASHNHLHAEAVAAHAANIVVSDGLWGVHEDVVIAAALLHDVCDHKYPESIPRSELDEFVRAEFDAWAAGRILWIIDNVSFSKQQRGGCSEPDTDLDALHLSIVRDADRIEALGETGIRRCEEYVRRIGGSVPEDVVAHCHEKLLRLYPGFFIRTWTGRDLARPLHRAVEEYVRVHTRA